MSDDRKKPDEGEVAEEQLEDVSGGVNDINTVAAKQKTTEPLDKKLPPMVMGSGGEDR